MIFIATTHKKLIQEHRIGKVFFSNILFSFTTVVSLTHLFSCKRSSPVYNWMVNYVNMYYFIYCLEYLLYNISLQLLIKHDKK